MGDMSDAEKLIYNELVEARRDIKEQLSDVRETLQTNTNDIATIKKDLAVHKVKTGILGTIGGGFAIAIQEAIKKVTGGP
jgi:hypothetical protein